MSVDRMLKNGCRLIISDHDQILFDINNIVFSPKVALVSAWRHEDSSYEKWQEIIEELIKRGCTYFVCAGTFAEELHDLIDDLIDISTSHDRPATSFHQDEYLEDVVNVFAYTATVLDEHKGTLVAILNKETKGDLYLYDILMTV